MKNSEKIRHVGGILALAVALAACGGGINPPGTTTTFSADLSGTVNKGIVKHGLITATELDVNGHPRAELGNAVTADNGSYTLTIADVYQGGPIELTLELDETSQMKCDAPAGCGVRDATDGITDTTPATIDFGEWYKPTSLIMTALVAEAHSGDTIRASITPFTHMAAVRAKASGTLNASTVFSTNSEV
ncbi:MAG: hypothetical protein OEW08_07250, partial [Gammaproteobacteria bacterium]|nr:hypothetical protein [Gammaproteobacteria bacterium]